MSLSQDFPSQAELSCKFSKMSWGISIFEPFNEISQFCFDAIVMSRHLINGGKFCQNFVAI